MLCIAICTSEMPLEPSPRPLSEKTVGDELNKGNDQGKVMLHIMLGHVV